MNDERWPLYLTLFWMSLLRILRLWLCLSLSAVLFGKCEMPLPVKPEGQGCQIQTTTLDHQTYWTHLHVWLQYPGARLVRLYSIRPGSEMSKSLKDCDAWLKCVGKATARLPRVTEAVPAKSY